MRTLTPWAMLLLALLFLSANFLDFEDDNDLCGTGRLPERNEQEAKGYGYGVGGHISKDGKDDFSEAKDDATTRANEEGNKDALGRAICPEKMKRDLSPKHEYTHLKEIYGGHENPLCESGTIEKDKEKWLRACRSQLGGKTDDCEQKVTQEHRPVWELCHAVVVSCYSYKCKWD